MAYPMKQKIMVRNGNEANREVAARLMVTAKGYAAKYGELGPDRIRGIISGQSPGKILIVQSRALQNKSHVPMEGAGIGERFKVSASFAGEVDAIGKGSAFYAFEHLKVSKADIFAGDAEGVTKANLSMSNMFGQFFLTPEAKIPKGIEFSLLRMVLVSCSDSRVVEQDVFAGHAIEVVNNAGNVLSPTALEAIGSLVYMGVPVIAVMGHSQCGAVGAALAENREEPLAPIMEMLGANIPEGGKEQSAAEIANVLASCRVLLGITDVGEHFDAHSVARLSVIRENVREKGTVVLPMYLDLANGEVTDLRPMLQGQ